MIHALQLAALVWIAAMLTVQVFKKPPLPRDEAQDEITRAKIMYKLNKAIDDIKSTV